jgi:undecaprenyl diphosphate synthase
MEKHITKRRPLSAMESFEEKLKVTAGRLGLKTDQIPHHIAIIMDGNGRWAQKKGLPRVEGHRQGAKTVEKIALDCVDFGIESLTIYSFSIENWKRPETEINALMHLYSEYLVGIRPTLMKNNVKLVHLGRLEGLPPMVQNELLTTMEQTSTNNGMKLALALNYGGRAEIVDATKKISKEYKKGKLQLEDINEQCISRNLYTAGLADPDLLIRTANEMRISNFLLWQISYSEFYVTKTLWPDFTKTSLQNAILAYAKRTRRFGNISARHQA